MSIETILGLIENLQPDMVDYVDNNMYHYWVKYSIQLDDLANIVHQRKDLTAELNHIMSKHFELDPEHHAAVDLATCLEETTEGYKGVFKYA